MQWVIPFNRLVDSPVNGAVPYDAADPYIFHSLTTVDGVDQLEALVKENAVIASKRIIQQNPSIPAAWDAASIPRGGQVEAIDIEAGDDQYVFMTPGYVYSEDHPTLAFRYSTLRAMTDLRFRFMDMMDTYETVILDDEDEEPDFEAYAKTMKVLAEAGTLSPADSSWFIPEFIHTAVGRQGRYSQQARELLMRLFTRYQNKGRSFDEIAEGIGRILDGVKTGSEVLSVNPIPIRAAELYFDPQKNAWRPMSSLTGTKINGLSAALMPKRTRRMIPGWKVR
jgi:hypothetical protein